MRNEGNGGGLLILAAIALYIAFLLFVIILLVATFLAILFTLLALLAWDKPLHLGDLTIEPENARAFVYRGLTGAVLLPCFMIFLEVIGVKVHWEYWYNLPLFGYTLGSVGVLYLQWRAAQEEARQFVPPIVRQPMRIDPPAPPKALPASSFRFASWDDEEELR